MATPALTCRGEVGEVATVPIPQPDGRPWGIVGLPCGGFAVGHGHCCPKVRCWSQEGVLMATLEGHVGPVRGLAVGPSGEIVSGSFDSTVKVWRDYTCVLTCVGHTDAVRDVVVSPSDGTIVSGSQDGSAKVWNGATGKCVATLMGHKGHVYAVCVLDNGDVVTGSTDKMVRVWAHGTWTCTTAHRHLYPVGALLAMPDNVFAVGSGNITGTGAVCEISGGRQMLYRELPRRVRSICAGKGWMAWSCFEGDADVARGVNVVGGVVGKTCGAATLVDGSLAVVLRHGDDFQHCRLEAIHVMTTAWAQCSGFPPPKPEGRAAALAATISLRRFCRPRGPSPAGHPLEVVEPFAKAIVGYL